MALSMPDPSNRTLPKLTSLLQNASNYPYGSRTSSLLEHRLSSTKPPESFLELTGRRNTVPCVSEPHNPSSLTYLQKAAPVTRVGETANLTRFESFLGKRNASLMAEDPQSKEESASNSSAVEGANFCLCQPDPKIPRPRNAFILYRQHQQASVVALNPGLSNPDISKIIGEQWRTLPTKSKDEWIALAEEEKARHQQQYPDYRYQPRRNGRYSGQSSISETWNSVTTGPQGSCLKCGGKRMNPPLNPYIPFTPVTTGHSQQMAPLSQQTRRAYVVPSQHNATPALTGPIASPPYSARIRPYGEVFSRQALHAHDHRPRYMDSRPPPPTPMSLESPDPKRRRFNGNNLYAPSRGEGYSDMQYSYSPRGTAFLRPEVMQPRSTMAPPPRSMYSQPPPLQLHAVRAPIHYSKRDPSLTLPPLKTTPAPSPLSPTEQSQQSGVEAMIMSVPVLNKIKILAQISPYLASPSVASPAPEIRGMIVAVEGLDAVSVYSMTSSLAEQLEREGEFAVRIFGGPVPYVSEEGTTRTEPMTTEIFLNAISEWHKISREMMQYITTKPTRESVLEKSIPVHEIEDALENHGRFHQNAAAPKDAAGDMHMSCRTQSTKGDYLERDVQMAEAATIVERTATPGEDITNSALTPTTISKAAGLALTSPDSTTTSFVAVPSNTAADRNSATRRPSHHIHERQTRSQTPQSHLPSSPSPRPVHTPTPIPIALVPHYQLTTVDASAVAMPITDAYSPLSHWQWLATLWRGCVGPDLTVAIMSSRGGAAVPGDGPDDDRRGSAERDGGGGGSGANAGVEVRLADCRAVVVRPGEGPRDKERENEGWEKAKRRVGFEVAEFLRR